MYWPDVFRVLAIVLCLIVMIGIGPAITLHERVTLRSQVLGVLIMVLFAGGVVAMLYGFGEPLSWYRELRYVVAGLLGLFFIYLSLAQVRKELLP